MTRWHRNEISAFREERGAPNRARKHSNAGGKTVVHVTSIDRCLFAIASSSESATSMLKNAFALQPAFFSAGDNGMPLEGHAVYNVPFAVKKGSQFAPLMTNADCKMAIASQGGRMSAQMTLRSRYYTHRQARGGGGGGGGRAGGGRVGDGGSYGSTFDPADRELASIFEKHAFC